MKQYNRNEKPPPEEPKAPKTRSEKPWILQRMWDNEEAWLKYNFIRPKGKFDKKWEDTWYTFMDVDHAMEQISKQARTYFGETKQNGRTWQIVNQDTGEVLQVTFEKHKVIIKEYEV